MFYTAWYSSFYKIEVFSRYFKNAYKLTMTLFYFVPIKKIFFHTYDQLLLKDGCISRRKNDNVKVLRN